MAAGDPFGLEGSRIETARIGISPDDLSRLVELYQLPDDQAKYLRMLAPSARVRGWWDAYAGSLSAGYAGLLRLESGRAMRGRGCVRASPRSWS